MQPNNTKNKIKEVINKLIEERLAKNNEKLTETVEEKLDKLEMQTLNLIEIRSLSKLLEISKDLSTSLGKTNCNLKSTEVNLDSFKFQASSISTRQELICSNW